jgi:hypothetical protein
MNKWKYFQRVREAYSNRGENVLQTKNIYPTKAEIKNECLKLLENTNNLTSNDRIIIRRYFELNESEALTKQKVRDSLDSFKTIIRFLKSEQNTKKIEAIDLLALLIDCKPRPHDFEKLETLHTNHKLKYDSLNQKLTTNFVGRDFVFKRISHFIKEKESGYYTVKGNAGIGKSSLALKYATDNNTLLHVIGFQNNSQNTVAKFIENITSQLRGKYQLSDKDFPKDYDKDGGFLEEILIEASKTIANNQKIVITVDGLDELSDLTKFRKENILHLPEVLPKGIFFLMTMRDIEDDVRMPNNEGDSEVYPLAHDGEENKADIIEYIKQTSKNEGIQEYLKKHSKKESQFIKEIEVKADGNFMYLYHVLREIEKGIYKDTKLNDLPQGLEGYYKDHWERMTRNISRIEEEVKYKTIYILSDMKSPVSVKTLGNIIKSNVKEASMITVQKAIEEWSQFLKVSYKNNDKEYTLYHKSFSDFLKEKDMIKLVGFNYDDVNEMVTRHMMGDYFED